MSIRHINVQPISKRDPQPTGTLRVHSVFKTIQGEGPFCGYPAIFVRLQGCNLQCPGCDTEYSLPEQHFVENNPVPPSQLLDYVSWMRLNTGIRLIVITGGEPFRQNIGPFVDLARRAGYIVQIETNGTLAPTDSFPRFEETVHIVVSPKTGKVDPSIASMADAYKYVLHHESVHTDGLPFLALGHSAKPYIARPPKHFDGRIYLQPMDCQDPIENLKNVSAVIASCEKHGYILQLQVHKYLGVP